MSLNKIKDLLSGIAPGGVVRSNSGVTINVSANGTTTVPAQELKDVLFKRFEEMSDHRDKSAAAKAD